MLVILRETSSPRKGSFHPGRNAALETNPNSTLLINNFDVSSAYDILVECCLEAGIKFDVIAIQSHMHQGWWGVEKTLKVLENFERFNLPIHFTETTLVSGHLMPPEIVDLNNYQITDWYSTPEGEERQAEQTIQHYTTLFSHPLVEGITWWDSSDGGWLNAPAGLLRRNGTAKPAYEELMKRIKGEWWISPTQRTINEIGEVKLDCFYGEYKLTYQGQQASFTVTKEGLTGIRLNS